MSQPLPRIQPNCRECGVEVLDDELTCPGCGAPRPALSHFSVGYEWQTEATWAGAPVIHIAFGMDATGRARTASGLIAIGQRATGGVAIGLVAMGFVSIGLVSVGVFSLGVVAVGCLFACGCNAVAPYAIGVVAFGYYAGGLAAFGSKILFSLVK